MFVAYCSVIIHVFQLPIWRYTTSTTPCEIAVRHSTHWCNVYIHASFVSVLSLCLYDIGCRTRMLPNRASPLLSFNYGFILNSLKKIGGYGYLLKQTCFLHIQFSSVRYSDMSALTLFWAIYVGPILGPTAYRAFRIFLPFDGNTISLRLFVDVCVALEIAISTFHVHLQKIGHRLSDLGGWV